MRGERTDTLKDGRMRREREEGMQKGTEGRGSVGEERRRNERRNTPSAISEPHVLKARARVFT
jgi:hypothetical protein